VKRLPIAIWLAALAFCVWIVAAQTRFNTDMAAFLPRAATPAQQLLVNQLRDGVTSRLVLLAVEGSRAEDLAATSKKLAKALQASGHFNYIRNSEQVLTPEERARLLQYRYLLSTKVDAAHFGVDGIRQALNDSLQLLVSPAGAMAKQLLPADPTGEMLTLLESWGGGERGGPTMQNGVLFSRDGKRALLLAETKVPAFDIDAQQIVGDAIRRAFAETRAGPELKLLMSGPSIFAVESRNRIHHDAVRLSLIATALVAVILLVAYRSPLLLLLGMLPVVSGALAGLAAVSLTFGSVHGITLGFGATLIGEAVDYPTYLFTQRAFNETLQQTLQRIWPTLRLAVLTTVFGCLTMVLSGFTGLSQLGMFSLSGVLVAGLMTRYVIPVIAPGRFAVKESTAMQNLLARSADAAARLKWVPVAVLAAASVYLGAHQETLWENDLANLSPIPEQAKALDRELRNELGAPDVGYLIAVPGADQQAALEHSEQLVPKLDALVRQGVTAGYDLAARVAPSRKTQAARQAALPGPGALWENLHAALVTSPFKEEVFEPFLRDVEKSRRLRPLQPADWRGTPLGSLAQGMLIRQGTEWVALISLRNVTDETSLKAFVTSLQTEGVFLLDLKGESSRMITEYRNQSLRYSVLGVVAIIAVLGFGLRNFRAVFAVLLPVIAAIAATAAMLATLGVKLSLFHIVSLLLVLGIGLNYGLFFNRSAVDQAERRRALFSVVVCAATTVSAFGILAFSVTQVLQAIGGTVALGAVMSLLFAAMWANHRPMQE
jgi:predicted exporter